MNVDDYAEATRAAMELDIDMLTNGAGDALQDFMINAVLDAIARLKEISTFYVVNPLVPLMRTEENGATMQALCWKIDGTFYVHPDRMPMFLNAMRGAGIAVAPQFAENAATEIINRLSFVPFRSLAQEWK